MFEQVCLTCGRHMANDDRLYCSQRCQSGDLVSPPISSSSSALSSPFMGYNDVQSDVPALALGSALLVASDNYASSASSTCWSATDDEDSSDSASDNRPRDDTVIEVGSKPIRFMPRSALYPQTMSYARRPSGVNNPGKSRNPSDRPLAYSSTVVGVPKSAPILTSHFDLSHPDEDESLSDASRDESDFASSLSSKPRERKRSHHSKRPKNRTSLPGYFSLLQFNPHQSEAKSNSSSNTINRLSPPTPKVGNPTSAVHPITAFNTTAATIPSASLPAPRGRRKVVDHSERAPSGSNSRERSATHKPRSIGDRSAEKVFDWEPILGLQHRPTIRGNISPPSKMLEISRMLVHRDRHATPVDEQCRAGVEERRGRYRTEDFQVPTFDDAPGFGLGRSGLVGRRQR